MEEWAAVMLGPYLSFDECIANDLLSDWDDVVFHWDDDDDDDDDDDNDDDEEEEEEEEEEQMEDDQKRAEEEGSNIDTGDGGGGGGGVSVELPPALVGSELLTRLPAKSLMRFKCVSKLWRSTICNTYFTKMHRARSGSRGCLFITYFDGCPSSPYLRCFHASLPCGGGKSQLLQQFPMPEYCSFSEFNGATEVINGLFCLYRNDMAYIWNISTCESKRLPWPNNMLIGFQRNYHYHLGFAPTCNKYKVLKIYSRFGRSDHILDFEIFTLGDDKDEDEDRDHALWRRLKVLPTIDLEPGRRSVYSLDGLCCWWHRSGFKLVVFNFEDESFQVIDLPPRVSIHKGLLLQFSGCFAVATKETLATSEQVLTRGFVRKSELWVLQLNYYQGRQSPAYEWIKQVVDIPDNILFHDCCFLGNLPSGDMLLTPSRIKIKSDLSVHSYSHTESKFDKFAIGKFPVFPIDATKIRVYYYEEDITPLKDLTPGK